MLGCNLRCGFCWVPDEKKIGVMCLPQMYEYISPEATYEKIKRLALAHNLKRVRVSGCEPLLNPEHLLSVIRMAVSDGYNYVLDTNGLPLTEEFLYSIKPFKQQIYIYMGLKGSTPQLFEELTTAEARFWHRQLEALRLIVKHGFTLGVNLMANLTPPETLPSLFSTLHKISPILPMCADLKYCTFFVHNSRRMKRYGLTKYPAKNVSEQWDWILAKHYHPQLVEIFQVRETSRAFDNYEVQTIYKTIEWHNGLKFVKLPDIGFTIPFSDNKCSLL